MPKRRISLALLAGALLTAGPALSQDGSGPSELEESLGRPKRVPDIPSALRVMVRKATRDRLVVRNLHGDDIVLDISDYEPENFRQFGDGRFLGFSFRGYEYSGYTLIDRERSGVEAEIGTGVEPVFSHDGRWFAAVQLSGAGWGNLEGFGIWEVTPSEVRQRFFNMALPAGEDWRVDGWPREDCVALSAAPISVSGSSEQATERLIISVEVGERIALDNVTTPPCGVTNATQPNG